MDNSSFFIKNKALFGSYPNQESVNELEKNGIKYFIDLTESQEKNIHDPYKTKYNYIHYPIKDNYVPTDWRTFASLIIKISKIIKSLKNDDKLYINCRAGHSRSALVVACLLCYIFNLSPQESLEYTSKCHSMRKNLRSRWKKLSAPHSFIQKKFVYKFFEPLRFYISSKNNVFSYGFSILSIHDIEVNSKLFLNAKLAYESSIEKYCLDNKIYKDEIDDKIKIKIMTNILKIKFETHKDIFDKLINTGLRSLIQYSKDDTFWSETINGLGLNYIGKILVNIRNKYYENEIKLE
jgi:protein-tyrosine phosphatase